jgi:Holliday junction resolvase RusA-like endonuclease
MQKEIVIKLPLVIIIPRKTKADKRAIINLNNYPHWHHFTYNEIKKLYKEELEEQLKDLKLEGRIKIEYSLFKKSKRPSDRMNVGAVQDKFFCDALTEHGCIEDDNDEIILGQSFGQTKIDKDNPRVEAKVIYNL